MARKSKTNTVIDTSNYDYPVLRVRGKDGKLRHVRGNGDSVVRALTLHTIVNGKSIDQVVRANKLTVGDYTNAGQLRMAVGGQLRGLIRNDTPVVIGDITLKSLDQRVPLDEEAVGTKRTKSAAKPAKKPKKARRARKAQPAGDGEQTASA